MTRPLRSGHSLCLAVITLVFTAAPAFAETKYVPSSDGWDKGTVKVNGEAYAHSLYTDDALDCYASTSTRVRRVNLSRDWEKFRSVIGLKDAGSSSKAEITFEIFGDDKLLVERTMGFGESRRVAIDVSDVLRLKLRVSWDDTGKGCPKGIPVFGKARLTR